MFDLSSIFLLLANIFPIFGVLFFNFDLAQILLLYWAESGIIGFYTLFKIIVLVKKTNSFTPRLAGLAFIPVFIVHFGIFMIVHLFILLSLIKTQNWGDAESTFTSNLLAGLPIVALINLFISHGVSFFRNFLGNKEYLEENSDGKVMLAPYKRIILMHLTILFGAFLAGYYKSSMPILVLLIVLKTAVDLFGHYKSHKAKHSSII